MRRTAEKLTPNGRFTTSPSRRIDADNSKASGFEPELQSAFRAAQQYSIPA
jgi:hypothetical protein